MSVPARQLPPPTVPERAAPIARRPAARPSPSTPPQRRARCGSTPAFWILAAVVVSSLVFTVVALNAVVVDTTYRTTAVQSEVRRLREVNAELRIEVARLSSPSRLGEWADAVGDPDAVKRDIANFRDALAGRNVEEAFMTAPPPGLVATRLRNEYYPTQEAYIYAIADAMKYEYRTIVESGLLLQIDCPDLSGRFVPGVQEEAYRADLELRVVPNPHLAVRAAVELLGPEDCLCATGSVYLAGIARNILLQNRAPGPAHRDERWEG